jgi:GDP-mannose 6-dehydrogenase
VLGLDDEPTQRALAQHCRADQTVIDLVRVRNRGDIAATVTGLCW